MCAGVVWSLSHYKRIPLSLSLSIPHTHTHTHTASLVSTFVIIIEQQGLRVMQVVLHSGVMEFSESPHCVRGVTCDVIMSLWFTSCLCAHCLSKDTTWAISLKLKYFYCTQTKKQITPNYNGTDFWKSYTKCRSQPTACNRLDLGKSLALLSLLLLPHKWKIEIIGGLSSWSCCEAWMRSPGTALGKLYGTQEGLSEGLQQIHQWDVLNIWNQGLPQDCSNRFSAKASLQREAAGLFLSRRRRSRWCSVKKPQEERSQCSMPWTSVSAQLVPNWYLISLHTWMWLYPPPATLEPCPGHLPPGRQNWVRLSSLESWN